MNHTKYFVVQHPHRRYGGGWGNGYVAVSPAHPLHGARYDLDFDYLDQFRPPVEVTFSERATPEMQRTAAIPASWWVFGFNTLHPTDDLTRWPCHRVIEATQQFHAWLVMQMAAVQAETA